MSIENRVSVITDTGSSIYPDSPIAKEQGITVVPLDIKFFENGEWNSMSDADITPKDLRSTSKAYATKEKIIICLVLNL